MSKKLKRRDFLKGLGSLLGGIVVTKAVKPNIAEDFAPPLEPEVEPEPVRKEFRIPTGYSMSGSPMWR